MSHSPFSLAPIASPAPLALSCYASSWGRMHFARCQRFFLLLPPILLLLIPLLQEHSVFPFLFFFCLRTLPSFLFLFFLLVRFLISRCGQTRRRISFSTCCSYATDNRISFCLPFKFWSTPLKTVQITPERLFAS